MALTVEDARRAFAEEIREVCDIRCDALIEGLARIPREQFLGPGPWRVVKPFRGLPMGMRSPANPDESPYRTTPDADPRRVYHNVLIAIDPERRLNNGQPTALLSWIDSLEPKPGERVLHVGAGVGYYTAVIAEAVGPTGSVLAVEYDAGLAARAAAHLAPWPQVRVVAGDGSTFDAGAFDAGFVNCGASKLMPAWLDNLAPSGRLLVPLTAEMAGQDYGFTLLVRRDGERWPARFTGGVSIYPCAGARDDASNAALVEMFKKGGVGKVRALRRDAHERDEQCVLHADGYCLASS
ncbi:MAG TPA: rRNA adenine N-6-methyltransferase family protein [Kofleriaceae bacterium]|jgi:protein-L-isoaspartate(D-aspartate) O-methyltransferase